MRNANELESALALLLSDRDQAAALGHNALNVVRANMGASVETIVEQLHGTDVYIAPK